MNEKAVEIIQHIKAATNSIFKKTEDIIQLLESKNIDDIKDGLSAFFENIGQGKDFSYYFPQAIKLIANNDIEIKRLASIIISEYSYKNPEISLLCVSTLQKGLKNQSHLLRALSLKSLVHLRSDLFYQLQYQSISYCLSDSSWYVKRIGCMGIPSILIYTRDMNDILFDLLLKFMDSKSINVLGSALVIFYFYFIDRLDALHKRFFRICRSLKSMDELHIPFTIELLIIYSRSYFCDQRKKETSSDSENGGNHGYMDNDFEFMLYCCLPLLNHRSSAIVVSVVRLILFCAPESFTIMILQPLIRLLTTKSYISSVITQNIDELLHEKRNLFDNYLNVFFVSVNDDIVTKKKKVDILIHLVNDKNCNQIYSEIILYTRYPQFEFAAYAISKLSEFCNKRPEMMNDVLNILLNLLKSNRNIIINEAMVVLRYILKHTVKSDDSMIIPHISRLIVQYEKLCDSKAKESVLWIVTEYSKKLEERAFDMLRIAAKNFPNEKSNVKYQTLILAIKIQNNEKVKILIDYVMNLAKYDLDHNIRDIHRFYTNIIKLQSDEKLPSNTIEKMSSLNQSGKQIFVDSYSKSAFQLMTLSFSLNKRMEGYSDLINFGASIDPVVRNEIEEEEEVEDLEESVSETNSVENSDDEEEDEDEKLTLD